MPNHFPYPSRMTSGTTDISGNPIPGRLITPTVASTQPVKSTASNACLPQYFLRESQAAKKCSFNARPSAPITTRADSSLSVEQVAVSEWFRRNRVSPAMGRRVRGGSWFTTGGLPERVHQLGQYAFRIVIDVLIRPCWRRMQNPRLVASIAIRL